MALYSDMNGFPEPGFPVLADMEDRITLNTLHYVPIRHLGYKIDVVGNNRLLGAIVLGGAMTGVTSIAMAGALSGATTIDASGNVTLSGGNLNITLGDIAMVGSIGSVLAHIKKAWLKDLHIENRPSCGAEDDVALVSDLQRIQQLQIDPLKLDPPQEFTFADIVAGTAKDYTLVLKAKYAFTIEGVCLETDNGTLTNVTVKIGSIPVTSISGITVDTAVDETAATGANLVNIGDRVWLSVGAGYSGTPTLITGSLIYRRV